MRRTESAIRRRKPEAPPSVRRRRGAQARDEAAPPDPLALVHELRVSQADLVRQAAEVARLRSELRGLRETHAEVFEHGPFACMIVDEAGAIVDCNLAASTLLGVPRSLLAGKILPRFATSRGREAFTQQLRTALRDGERTEHEAELLRADGARVHVRARCTGIGPPEERRVVVGLMDVTELLRMRAELLRARRGEALGRLTRSVAHDINNLLMGIAGPAEMALRELPPTSRAHALVAELKAAALRGALLAGKLVTSKAHEPPREGTDVDEVVARSEVLLRGVLGERVELHLRLAHDGGRVPLSAEDLERILLNLATNARHAMPGGGRLSVEVRRLELTVEGARALLVLAPGRHVVLSVKDTGVGMDAATRARVFEPFFSGRSHGTGLGLATVRELVERAGGHVHLESVVGRGTTVRVLLPCLLEGSSDEPRSVLAPGSAPEAASEGAEAAPAPAFAAAPTVLIVEDGEPAREAVSLFLHAHGYRVLAAGGAAEALRVCGAHAGPIDALLVDIGLADGRGDLLVDDLLAAHPGAGVVLVSGRERSDEVVKRALVHHDATFMQKPFELERLAKVLGAVIQRR